MVSDVVSKLEFVGLAAERDARELMSEADSENGLPPHQASNVVDGVRAWFRIAGAIREKNSVRLQPKNIFGRRLRRDDCYFATYASQFSEDVVLDPVIVGDNMKARRFVFHADNLIR